MVRLLEVEHKLFSGSLGFLKMRNDGMEQCQHGESELTKREELEWRDSALPREALDCRCSMFVV